MVIARGKKIPDAPRMRSLMRRNINQYNFRNIGQLTAQCCPRRSLSQSNAAVAAMTLHQVRISILVWPKCVRWAENEGRVARERRPEPFIFLLWLLFFFLFLNVEALKIMVRFGGGVIIGILVGWSYRKDRPLSHRKIASEVESHQSSTISDDISFSYAPRCLTFSL